MVGRWTDRISHLAGDAGAFNCRLYRVERERFYREHIGRQSDLALDATVPTIAGGFVGAGFETKLTSSISLKGEYRFTDFGSGAVTLPNIDGTDLNQFVTARVSPTLQIVKASANYRF